MSKRNDQTHERNKREQARKLRAAKRRARKRARANEDSGNDESELVQDPLYQDKPSDAEVQAAIELAMNPGGARREAEKTPKGPSGQEVGRRLFVGNLDFGINEAELRELFSQNGFEVVETRLIRDRETGKPRGFAFVDLAGPEQAAKAIEAFDGTEFAGRQLRVNPAEQR